MKVLFVAHIECLEDGYLQMIYRESSMPFAPEKGLRMYMDDCEHEVVSVFWDHQDQELTVNLNSWQYDTTEEAKHQVSCWVDSGWSKE